MAMDWDKLRVFLSVAEAGSFTHAGEGLSLSQSAVSRQISALEDSLTVPLFHRHARGLILTEQGELLFRTAKEIFAKLAMTEAMLNDDELDLSMREADVAIRMTVPRQGDLIQRHLATFHFHLYAAPGYLRRHG